MNKFAEELTQKLWNAWASGEQVPALTAIMEPALKEVRLKARDKILAEFRSLDGVIAVNTVLDVIKQMKEEDLR
jgi:hypothetical protein